MDISLLKQLGRIEQIAGIRESQLLRGREQGVRIAEVYNAAGLRFSVTPDRCMDIFEMSYRGVNVAFQSKNGLTSPLWCSTGGIFAEQWCGGLLSTCGLDNVGGGCTGDGIYPTHGRISTTPASSFAAEANWENDDYLLRVRGEMHLTRMFGYHLSLKRTIETSLNSKCLRICDEITNHEAEEQPYMLLYHCNFGYPLLQPDSRMLISSRSVEQLNGLRGDCHSAGAPIDGAGEELYLHKSFGKTGCAVLVHEASSLGAYVAFDTETLPNMAQWKRMKSHDYVAAFEPCNTCGLNRQEAAAQNKIAVLPPYSSVKTNLEIGMLDGMDEIETFIQEHGCC